MTDVSALYPQPSQPGGLLGGNPLQALSAVSQMNALARFNAEFNAKKAVGQAFQNALQPDGSVDIGRLTSGLQNPAASYAAPEAIGTLLDQRNKMLDLDTNQFKLNAATNGATQDFIAGLAGNPNVTADDVANGLVEFARRNPGIPSSQISSILRTMPQSGKSADIQNWAKTYQNIQAGPATTIQRVPGPPGAGGAPTSQPLGQANVAGATPVGNPAGFNEAAAVSGSGAAGQGLELGKAADSSPVRKAMLGNLEADLQNFTSGPGADWTKVAKAWANRNVLPQSFQFDPRSIADQESFVKQAEQLAQQQFQAIGGTGTDAKFGSAFKSNPNDTLSQLGNKGIIRLLKGNEDALQAKNRAWQAWLANGDPNQPSAPHGSDTYQQFSARFNQTFDPRVYQSQYMAKDDFVKMIKAMSPAEQAKFRANLEYAKSNEFASSPGSSYNGQ